MNQLRVDYTQAVNSRYSHSVHIVSPSTQVFSPNNGVLYKLLSQVWSFQTPVTVHFSFLVLLVLSFLGGLKDKNALWSIFLILYFGPFLFITILIHEFGHIVMTKALGGEVLGLVLWPLGGGGGGGGGGMLYVAPRTKDHVATWRWRWLVRWLNSLKEQSGMDFMY
jgi:Zn-dependent protease